MLSTFEIPKNLVAVIGALALAVMVASSPSAYAEDTPSPENLATTGDFIFGEGDLEELRHMLITPELSDEKRGTLRRTLDSLDEEIA